MKKLDTEEISLGHCKFCNEEVFGTHHNKLIAHQRYCICNSNRDKAIEARKRGSMTMHNKVAEKTRQHKIEVESTRKPRTLYCKRDGKPYTLNLTDPEYQLVLDNPDTHPFTKYCSSYCAHVRHLSAESKAKGSETRKKHIKSVVPQRKFKPQKIHTCKKCGRDFVGRQFGDFCSQECKDTYVKPPMSAETRKKLSEAGKRSAAKMSELRRSKNEMLFCQMCEEFFSNVEHNKPMFNGWDADVIIHDIKYAVLWNGKWHYVEIMKKKNTLKAIQNRDRIKENEIAKANWNLYVIKDMGKYNPNFVKAKFDEFIEFLRLRGILMAG